MLRNASVEKKEMAAQAAVAVRKHFADRLFGMFSGRFELFLIRLRSSALTSALFQSGAISWRCPLKTTPASRPPGRTSNGAGR